ncbi:ATP-binding protein [Methyloradius palustris]|uniref:histidine kinase n=1 Tax=Methyloradius palustris TaxID=2778876 RepID=A0A8D5JVV8_9PROT|nr:ATP-binding protein [Methyloradius palustris]BCM24494.1 two-component sensor histidine kinase [Methyloradius palustris]
MSASSLSSVTTLTNLRRLVWLRFLMAALLGISTLVAIEFYDLDIPMRIISSAAILALVVNLTTLWRLRHSTTVSNPELFIQLLLDILILTAVFYDTGGYSNPFIWMFLLSIVVSAVALPWLYTWVIAGVSIACYSSLMFWYKPLNLMMSKMIGMDGMAGMSDHDMPMSSMPMDHTGFGIHLVGMWAGFVVAAVVIAIFVERMAFNLREHDRLLAETREKMLENERMLALGTLAAGAAHELSTPLSTIAILLQELRQGHSKDELDQSLEIMTKQVDVCKQALLSITLSGGNVRAEAGQRTTIRIFLEQVLQQWQDRRPGIVMQTKLSGIEPLAVITDRALGQAFVNLLDNAADASPQAVEVDANWTATDLVLDIHDQGEGLDISTLHQIGQAGFTTKEDMGGLGLGVFLAKSVIERLGGTLQFIMRETGGTLTRITLPLDKLKV